ncbi:bifunctional serine/threonine-protein kinase/formylglycine-generating enzyme family protein [Acaryochloris sp. CCMEE 5410]|uniref:bifunctional serine/threonine-protein kinase/formylglycine-generating enzyme family protein n=1 Tax=Acaryochloris sp. CCMEE 5410 TaxID=310037 RepID=UPI00024838F7|nr:bifunctional serine/threonine-protein kinase/formylglycine-generating enzyme family protein [Acaryochloris sp. CCMEE 5410]KAI9134536.1 SUMF1/EgtB/PvdO family nonheme iron enzyme [Acaryochloris sp. CCMEE 5410]
MLHCPNPTCTHPQNLDGRATCQNCGQPLIGILRHRYHIIKPIGQGGFGITYLAEDIERFNETCVVKQLIYQSPDSPGAQQKVQALFTQEAQQLFQLGTHPQIPNLLAYFHEEGRQYLVQEFIEGHNLSQVLKREGVFNEAKLRHFLASILPVLGYIHSQGVIHRDLKPHNIMHRPADDRYFLIDFGVTKQVNGQETVGTVLGSEGYAAFEQLRDGRAYPASDLYSLGVTCFQFLTGHDPRSLQLQIGYSWTQTWQKHLCQPLSPQLVDIIHKLLQINLEHRYASVEDVLKDLKNPQPLSTEVQNASHRQPTVDRQSYKLELAQATDRTAIICEPRSAIPAVSASQLEYPPLQATQFEVATLNVMGQIQSVQTQTAQYFIEALGDDLSLSMIAIPAGSILMGSPSTETARRNSEGPQHHVSVPNFYMGQFPITQAQWQTVAALPTINQALSLDPSQFKGPDHPVENISWLDAVEFCGRLTQKFKRLYRLPSEAEWEYACRANTTTPFHWGETLTADHANFHGMKTYRLAPKGQYRNQTTPVGSFRPNAFGLYDMHGNVWEWCADHWHPNYQDAPVDGSIWFAQDDDRAAQTTHPWRGGSWYDAPASCRAAYRTFADADFKSSNLGFRVVSPVLSP